jgi:hypothetical protein
VGLHRHGREVPRAVFAGKSEGHVGNLVTRDRQCRKQGRVPVV